MGDTTTGDTKIFSVKCFCDGQARPTHILTQDEARIFRKAALHLVEYLTNAYWLDKAKTEAGGAGCE